MKETWIAFLACLIIPVMLACSNTAGNEDSAPQMNTYENPLMTVSVPSEWEVWDDDFEKMGMLRIRHRGDVNATQPTIHVKIEGKMAGKQDCAAQPQAHIAKMAEKYNGTAPEKTNYGGIVFHKTTYNYGGTQTMMMSNRDGSCITITLAGLGVGDDPNIPDILSSLAFK